MSKTSHHAQYCKCDKCTKRRTNKKKGINNDWQTFRGNVKAWHQQNKRDEKRYNDLCGEVKVTKIKDKDEKE